MFYQLEFLAVKSHPKLSAVVFPQPIGVTHAQESNSGYLIQKLAQA